MSCRPSNIEHGVLALILEKALVELLLDGRTLQVWPGFLHRIPLRWLALLDNHSQTLECAEILKRDLPLCHLCVGDPARRNCGKNKGRCCIGTRTRNRMDSLLPRWNRYHKRTGLMARSETEGRSPVSCGELEVIVKCQCTEPTTVRHMAPRA